MIRLLLLLPVFAFAQVPVSPIGPVFTGAQTAQARGAGAYCGADKRLVSVTFSWREYPGAGGYEVQAQDGCTLTPAITLDAWRSASICANGVCSFTSGAYIADGLSAIWSVRKTDASGNATGSWSQNVSFVIDPPGLASYESNPCSWYYASDAPGQSRRLIDFNTARGGNAFPQYQWTTVDVSDLVPDGSVAIQVLAHFIFSVISGEPILAYKTRRHGSTFDPETNGGLVYSTSHRDPQEKIILLGPDRKFDFYWSDTANGKGPALDGAGVASAWAVNMTVTGYCK